MAVTTSNNVNSGTSDTMLWAGVLLGPLAWALDEGLSYSLAQHACSTGHSYVMHVITFSCLLLAISGVVIAFGQKLRIGSRNEEGGSRLDRSWWMARLGIALSLGFSLVIVAMAVPKFLLSPCD